MTSDCGDGERGDGERGDDGDDTMGGGYNLLRATRVAVSSAIRKSSVLILSTRSGDTGRMHVRMRASM